MIKFCRLSTIRANRAGNSFTWDLEYINEYGRNNFSQICLTSILLNFKITDNMKIFCNVLDKSPYNELGILYCLPGSKGMSHKANSIQGKP